MPPADQFPSDREYIQRLQQRDLDAFKGLYERYDPAVLRLVSRQLRGIGDRVDLTRAIADDLWLRLWQHPEYLSRHDPDRRPLFHYLALLVVRQAQRCRNQRRPKKACPRQLALGNLAYCFAGQEDEELWEQVLAVVQPAELRFLRRALARENLTEAQQHQLDELIRKIRERLHLD